MESLDWKQDQKSKRLIDAIACNIDYRQNNALGKLNHSLPLRRQGSVQMRTFEPTNASADCWSFVHSYNFTIRVK